MSNLIPGRFHWTKAVTVNQYSQLRQATTVEDMNETNIIEISTIEAELTTGYFEVHDQYWEDSFSTFLYAGPSIFLLIVGTIGNILSFMVFNKKSMMKSVTSMYFRVLAITDTIVLFSGGVVFFLVGAFGRDVRLYSGLSCKLFVAILKVSCYHSCWVLVLISVDRFIGVYIPHKYRQYCTKRKAIIAMLVLLVVVLAFVGGFWVTSLVVDHGTCGIAGNYLYFFNEVYQWLDLGLLNLIPSIILVTTNVAIVIKISHSFGGDECKESTKSGGSGTNSLTLILLSVSLVYMLCTIPTSTAFLVIRQFTGPRGAARTTLYIRCCETLYLLNHSVNFFLYCVHGTTFRKELKSLFWKTPGSATTTNSTAMSAYTVSHTEEK